ncbi:MAG: NAD(P)H-hydrate dehydratase [Planctomycetota bacterium]|nr:NAD(P)H-hydrate dehydratase [Planctomycetota bacterium]
MNTPRLPARPRDGHKGTFGTVAIVGGCAAPPDTVGGAHMAGAPALAALGALRIGAGLAKMVCPAAVLPTAIGLVPSATGIVLPTDADGCIVAHEAAAVLDQLVESADAIVIGPGLGSGGEHNTPSATAVEAIALRAIGQDLTPVVVDADALNALARVPDLAREFRATAVLTPHPGEFRRLAAALNISHDPTDPTDATQRPLAAEALAQRLGCMVVLKGAGTVVSDGQRTWTCPNGHPCLATAGTGDVLAGAIGGLIAQFVKPPDPLMAGLSAQARAALGASSGNDPAAMDLFDAARAGVLIHALAGERWASAHHASAGLLAAELAGLLPVCAESIRDG